MNKIPCTVFESRILDEAYSRYTLDCGLDVYVFPKKLSAVYALFGVKYGSVDNTFTLSDGSRITVPDGIAHFLEHKLFFNEDGSDSFERFSEYGADANAYTAFDKTAYLFSCTEGLKDSLAELTEFVTHPYFTEESVASERGIIAEEIKMYDDSPADRCLCGMLEGMYEKHSVRRNICGSVSSIEKITPRLLYDCYNSFYRPDNMALVICGDVCADEIIQTVSAHIPSNFCGKSVKRINENALENRTVFRSYVERQMQVSKPLVCIGFKDTEIPFSPQERLKKDAVMSILDEMLFSHSGEFYNSLFERSVISPAMSYGYTISETFAYHSLSCEADEPRLVLDELMHFIAEKKRTGLSKEDFNRAKRVMYAEAVRIFDSTESIANAMFSFICEGCNLLEYADMLEAVGFEDVVRALNGAFIPDTVTLSVVNPLNNSER